MKVIDKYRSGSFCLYKNAKISEALYCIGFVLLVGMQSWTATMLPQSVLVKKICAILSFMVLGIKIVFFDCFSPKESIFLLFGIGTGAVSFLQSGYIYFLLVFWLSMAGQGIKADTSLKLSLIVVLSITVFAFIGSKIGLIEDVIYDLYEHSSFLGWELDESHALGSIYTTDAAARLFFCCLLCFYLGRVKTCFLFSILFSFGSVLSFVITRGRLDSICLFLLSLVSLLAHLVVKTNSTKLNNAWKKIWSAFALFSMPLAAVLSLLSCYFSDTISKMKWIDESLQSRIFLGKTAIERYGLNLFGHEIELIGNGHLSQNNLYQQTQEYNYLDVSYIQILMIYGILALMIVVGIYTYISWKNREDTYLMIVICFISLNCMVAHHLLDVSYIPFIVFLTTYNKHIEVTDTNSLKVGNII